MLRVSDLQTQARDTNLWLRTERITVERPVRLREVSAYVRCLLAEVGLQLLYVSVKVVFARTSVRKAHTIVSDIRIKVS